MAVAGNSRIGHAVVMRQAEVGRKKSASGWNQMLAQAFRYSVHWPRCSLKSG
jgi:hypothetical protein